MSESVELAVAELLGAVATLQNHSRNQEARVEELDRQLADAQREKAELVEALRPFVISKQEGLANVSGRVSFKVAHAVNATTVLQMVGALENKEAKRE